MAQGPNGPLEVHTVPQCFKIAGQAFNKISASGGNTGLSSVLLDKEARLTVQHQRRF